MTNDSRSNSQQPISSLSIAETKRKEMLDKNSDLRNQVTADDTIDFQLLNNTPAQVIQAMTGASMEKLSARAEQLEVSLKGSLANDMPAARSN